MVSRFLFAVATSPGRGRRAPVLFSLGLRGLSSRTSRASPIAALAEAVCRAASSASKERAGSQDLLFQKARELLQQAQDLLELATLARSEGDEQFATECGDRLVSLWEEAAPAVVEAALSGPSAAQGCFVEVHSGEGGADAMDWCRMLGEMYSAWAQLQGFHSEQVAEVPGEVDGLRSLTMRISGDLSFGLLAAEAGVHRLIRMSPYDRKGQRHTSFSVVLVIPEESNDSSSERKIPKNELRVEVMRASGPGGQSVNMSDSAVRITHLPTGHSVRCQRLSSQQENHKMAMKLLCAKLRASEASRKRLERAALFTPAALEASAASERRVRTYTLHPRELVKDSRFGLAFPDASSVISGAGLQPFLECGVLWSAYQQLTGESWRADHYSPPQRRL